MFPARYWSPLPDQLVWCRLCPRGCKIKPGAHGFCQNRENLGGKLYLNSYAKASGFQLDPIEKKPLFHFYPGSGVLSFGTIGCNLGCKFCQNWDISKKDDWDAFARRAEPQEIARSAKELGATSVAMTYNDPVIYLEFATDMAKACRAEGLQVVLVTAGYINPEPREELYAQVDAANVDLKAFNPTFYKHLCKAQLEPVKETLAYLAQKTQVWLEVTTLLIEGENDDPKELAAMAEWIGAELGPEVPLHFSAFHPDFKMTDHPATQLKSLQKAREIALQAGLKFVYTGNVHHQEGSRTNCPKCRQPVIERDWFQVLSYHLGPGGFCQHCGHQLAGRFGNSPGQASPRPVRVGL